MPTALQANNIRGRKAGADKNKMLKALFSKRGDVVNLSGSFSARLRQALASCIAVGKTI